MEEEDQKKKKISRRARDRQAAKIKKQLDQLSSFNQQVDRRFHYLSVNPQRKKYKEELSDEEKKNNFGVFLDIENLRDDFPQNFDFTKLLARITAVIQSRFQNPNIKIKKALAIGNMWVLYNKLGVSRRRNTRWGGIDLVDVAPRDSTCFNCEEKFQSAVAARRRPITHERVTDIADDLLQHAMFSYIQQYGPGNILIITGDQDFKRPMEFLKKLGATVYLAKPASCSQKLQLLLLAAFSNSNKSSI